MIAGYVAHFHADQAHLQGHGQRQGQGRRGDFHRRGDARAGRHCFWRWLLRPHHLHVGVQDAQFVSGHAVADKVDRGAGHVTGAQQRRELTAELSCQPVVHIGPQVAFQVGVHSGEW